MRFCFTLACFAGMTVVLNAGTVPESDRIVKTVVRADARTGRLVRAVVVTPQVVRANVIAARPVVVEPAVLEREAPAGPPGTFREAVDRIAERNSLPPQLVHSVIRVESNYNPYAVSNKGALGLMQLIPSTARRFGVNNVFNPEQNVEGGARYLRYLLDLYHGDYRLALAAYNAGEGAVAKHGGVPPYPETQNYIRQVGKRLAESKPAASKQKEKAPPPEAPKPEFNPIRKIVEPDGYVHYVSR